MTKDKTNYRMITHHDLEPRVAKLETGIEQLARNMTELTSIVREQGKTSETQIQGLLVAVTTAAGPRKTDWGTIIASVGLVMVIGAAAFSPLYLRVGDLQTTDIRFEERFERHRELTLHPVGQAKVDSLEKSLIESKITLKEEIEKLDAKLQKEYQLMSDVQKESSKGHDKSIADLDTRLQREFIALDTNSRERSSRNLSRIDELEKIVRDNRILENERLYQKSIKQ